MRVLSGIQPTGRFHWGNYFGAIRQYIQLQDADEAYYFIANLHALTTVRDPHTLRQNTLDAALDLLALGLDPQRAVLFIQSDVPEVSELCWLLMTGAPLGLLERCHAYKEKKARGVTADAGLFTYPILMAADILAYDADTVPVGEDQVQHIEVCRDLAGSFNHQFGATFVLPQAKLLEDSAKVAGTDGEKMSKSYSNTIEIFEPVASVRKKVMRIVTDSRPMEQPKDPQSDHLFQLYALFADREARDEMAALYRRGGFGYGQVKTALAEAAERYFATARARRAALAGDPPRVREILADGARRARAKAQAVLQRAQQACGVRLLTREANVIGIGTDIVECLRIAQMIERHGELFITRVYTQKEFEYCSSRKAATQHYAGRWAAKEAVLKSLGTGWARGITWRDIEVRNDEAGRPRIALAGGARQVCEKLGITEVQISISHCRTHATALAIALGQPRPASEPDRPA